MNELQNILTVYTAM